MYMRNQINYEEKKGELNVKPKLYRFLHCIIELDIFANYCTIFHFPFGTRIGQSLFFIFLYIPRTSTPFLDRLEFV